MLNHIPAWPEVNLGGSSHFLVQVLDAGKKTDCTTCIVSAQKMPLC